MADTEFPPVVREAVEQLNEYFAGNRNEFDLQLDYEGSEFQKRVWAELLKIPFGKTRSYKEMAQNLGDPKCIRAAATANGKNPIVVVIPCHRVIGKDGSLVGFGGGLERKKYLLKHESTYIQGSLF